MIALFALGNLRLRSAVREWDMSSHDEGDLLSGARLVEAESWLAKRSEDLSSAERQFIEKGLEFREGKLQSEERRRQKELVAARQLADESEANGETIISASDDKSIKLWKWDGRNGSLMTTLFGHTAGVTDINPSDDGQIFASASADGTVILWNLNLDLKLDDLLRRGCSWAQDYLQNPHNGMSKNDQRRRLCDRVK